MNLKQQSELPVHRVTEDPNNSYCLPKEYYTTQSVFDAEIEKIFFKSWVYAGHISKLSKRGDYITVDVHDQSIIIIKENANSISAYYNVCQHRAHTLLEGEGRALAITCPAHSWSYGLNGQLRSGPGLNELANFSTSSVCLTSVRVEEFCGLVFVNLDNDAEPLAGQVDGLKEKILSYVPHPEELVLAHRATREVKANWKCMMDNYLECYHCKSTHKRFCELVDMEGYSTTPYDNWSWHQGPGFPDPNSNEAEQTVNESFAGAQLWPNMTINFFPGRDNELMLFIAIPIDTETCLDIFEFYMPSAEITEETRAEIDWVVNVLTEEDIGLVENVQRGLKSKGFKDGRFVVNPQRSYLSEHAVHHFHRKILAVLEAE
ncbi:aromatic ring-hydroxylating oxygenase subunit alpha [Pseudocolwellia agarivorans]|uniref:aromatic ring-hydroxylating oxygenase subunit alpha n=1 Tax=Pseudocolwellia agarivorans TaxID=1911682 RepID=UPI00098626A9|nr:aromatic ring-hydroxylating dioxygenase subunit alpha [Pseudocolwellia agarivorans]